MQRNIVITGANRGIGLAMVKHYVANGDTVYGVCRTSSDELEATGAKVISGIDVAIEEQRTNLAEALSGVEIDILINNAGILRDESLASPNLETIRDQFEVNAIAPIAVTSKLLGHLKPGTKLAFITSRMGSIADNTSGGRYGYRMSKAALNIGAMSVAQDLKSKDIAVGIYHPGYVQTDMVQGRGDISASESAGKIVNLIEALTLEQTGVFSHSNGEVLPW